MIKKRSGIILDIAVPVYGKICAKEGEKVKKYQDLKREARMVWEQRKGDIIYVKVGAF